LGCVSSTAGVAGSGFLATDTFLTTE